MGTQIRFWMDAWKNEAKSKEAGIHVSDTVPWCEIRVLGESDSVKGPVHVLAKSGKDPRTLYADAWAAWQRDNSTEGIVGTMLRDVAWLGAGEVETLKYLGIRTLENLASVDDGSITRVPGGLALRQKARDTLSAAKASAPVQKMSEELAKRDAEIASLKSQIAEIVAANRGLTQANGGGTPTTSEQEFTAAAGRPPSNIERLQNGIDDPPKRRPGRPRKNPEA